MSPKKHTIPAEYLCVKILIDYEEFQRLSAVEESYNKLTCPEKKNSSPSQEENIAEPEARASSPSSDQIGTGASIPPVEILGGLPRQFRPQSEVVSDAVLTKSTTPKQDVAVIPDFASPTKPKKAKKAVKSRRNQKGGGNKFSHESLLF